MLQSADAAAQAPSCTLQKEVYTCRLAPFRRTLAASHSVAVEAGPMDRFARAQLRHLATELGKTVAAPGQPADLTFVLEPIEGHAIEVGPWDVPLASLRVISPGLDSPRGTLVWAETISGQPDRPWPETVHALLQQFRDHLAAH